MCSSDLFAYNHAQKLTEKSEVSPIPPSFDLLYCSDDWNISINRMIYLSNADYDKYFLDFDYWCNCQDFANMSTENINVIETKETTAIVNLDHYNMGAKTHMQLRMVFENNNWFIDDFCTINKDNGDTINCLKDAIKKNNDEP